MSAYLIIDNYDSFTYNLVHCIRELTGERPDVVRNNAYSLSNLEAYKGIILSPGPGIPSEAGLLLESIRHCAGHQRIFGVCLGLQAITEVFGGSLINLRKVFHGVATNIQIHQPAHYLFRDLPRQIQAGRYHSWAADSQTLPDCLQVSASDDQGTIMALHHNTLDICAVQFHPESLLTPQGKNILANWLQKTP